MKSKKKETDFFDTQYKEFYLQHAGELIFFARKFVDRHTAEDIVQDIFLKIWDRKSTIVVEGDMKNYLRSMVEHACFDYMKHQTVENNFMQKSIRQIQLDELNYYESSNDYPSENEKMETLFACIEKLPPKRKDVFKKFFFEEQKHADIARELEISVRTVETHIYKALKFLREYKITFLFIVLLGVEYVVTI
ncbi:MAG: RNA polymerase sigma-70 factor [Porphyromonadaceae bacterium]|nr:RNA polymerase sigma-70 factor [Porphyromonadaceae bacterium]